MSGFFAARGSIDGDLLDRIVTQAAHRGAPDVFADEQVALVAFGSQVYRSEDLVVAADARIDEGPAGGSPAERIARAWREGTWTDLVGDFAAAIWEKRTQTLHVVRDAIGGRPALTCVADGRITAGSSVAMLLADPRTGREIDDEWVEAFLTLAPRFETVAGYRGMARIEPGSIAAGDAGRWRTRTWYAIPRRPVRLADDAAYAHAFRELFEQATSYRVGDATRVAVPLSGGQDSTSVAAAARSVRPHVDLLALSMPFRTPKGDERALQTLVAEHVGARQRWVEVIGRNPYGEGASETLDAYGTPFVSPNSFQIEALADAAAEEGAQVVLDGIDGDGVVGGNFFFIADLLVTGRWIRMLRELEGLRRVRGASRKRALKHLGLMRLMPQWLRRHPDEVRDWFGSALRVHAPEEPWRPGRMFRSDRMLALRGGATAQVLEVLDEQYARRGLRIEHPFMDRRLIEFCANLPREQITGNGYTKVVLRAAMRDLLPRAVTERAAKADVSEALREGLSGMWRKETQQGLTYLLERGVPWVRAEGLAMLGDPDASEDVLYDAFRVAWVGHWLRWSASRATVRPVGMERNT